MRAINKKGNFQNYFHKRFVVDLRETINFIIEAYEKDTPDDDISEFDDTFDWVSRRIDKHVGLAEILKDCGFWGKELEDIEEGLKLLSQGLDMGALYPCEGFISPAVKYLEKNYLVGLPLF